MAEAPQTRPSLLVRVRNREDGPAWAQFVALYAPLIHGYARRHGLQDADAADLTQDVLRAVAGAVPRLEYDPRRGSFRGWLFTIVRNKLRNFARKQQHRPQPGTDGDACEELEQPAEPDTEWDQDYQRRVLAWAAEQVRPSVAPATWQAFWQTAVEGRKAGEVAARLGMAVASVYMARSRVLAKLKDAVREFLGDDAGE